MADTIEVVMKPRTIKIKINTYAERSEILKCLALSGRKVWQEEDEREYGSSDQNFYVCLEVNEDEIE